jgi:hypothetical protein
MPAVVAMPVEVVTAAVEVMLAAVAMPVEVVTAAVEVVILARSTGRESARGGAYQLRRFAWELAALDILLSC